MVRSMVCSWLDVWNGWAARDRNKSSRHTVHAGGGLLDGDRR
jgi:hypothetical protein